LPLQIKTDPTRLRQILMNILENSIKFTDKGEVEIQVQQKPSGLGAGWGSLEFRIRDTGIGIKPEQTKKLFQSFSQADSSMTRRFGGTGLGLVLARKLAKLLGGDVTLESSTYNVGSVFLVAITYQEVDSLQSGSADKPGLSSDLSAPAAEFKNIDKVLIVDDASDNRILFQRYLMKMGIRADQIDMAENGQKAIEMAKQIPYSLILLDIQMPVMDGLQAIMELRKSHYTGMVVALTAHAMKGYDQACLAAGFDDYLQKPLNQESLKNILLKVH
jgi:two-component system, sensor histidine kinase